MSAIFRAEIDGLMRLVARAERDQAHDVDERDRIRAERAASLEADRQAVIDTLRGAERHMTSTEVAARAGVSRQRTDRILMRLLDQQIVSRRRRATRRADGEGHRNPYKYVIAE